MAPTICGDANDSSNLREVRKSSTETVSTFSVINYVGKIQKPRTSKYNTPYSTQSQLQHSSNNNQGLASPSSPMTIPSCIRRIQRIRRRQNDSSSESTISGYDGECSDSDGNSERPEDDAEDEEEKEQNNVFLMLQENQRRLMRARSMSITSSSGCSSSMEEVQCELSPADNCRCNTNNISDFDDDGFRDESPQMREPCINNNNANPNFQCTSAINASSLKQLRPNSRGLLEIAVKTVRLMRRNQELQAKLTQLQSETDTFISSVMKNPENQTLRIQMEATKK